jgi:demethylmenaquinone methyltransferase/2-methoxy-6-polyprenyl-1,4-benzoquinol methylase
MNAMSRAIQSMFAEVSPRYELINRILTIGLDRVWRERAAEFAARIGGEVWLDMCSGTGEMAAYLHRLARCETRILVVDFSQQMLTKARQKLETDQVIFLIADAKTLPIPSNSLDLLTVSFAMRNIRVSRPALIQALQEFHRVLKPKGLLVSLETSQPPSRIVRWLFHFYVRWFVKALGRAISGSKSGYAYLSSTVRHFYGAEALAEIMSKAGFGHVRFYRMMSGIVAIHEGIK